MVGWHHQLNGDESEQTPGDGEERGKPGVPQTMELLHVASQAACFISGWLQWVLGKEFSFGRKSKNVFIHSICSSIDPQGACEENQSG